jgi:CheY-like chemotaxis protein
MASLLIVDDEPEIREVLVGLLTVAGQAFGPADSNIRIAAPCVSSLMELLRPSPRQRVLVASR